MANEVKRWKGAVEPNDDGTASSNQVKLWKGAVEPTETAAGGGGGLKAGSLSLMGVGLSLSSFAVVIELIMRKLGT